MRSIGAGIGILVLWAVTGIVPADEAVRGELVFPATQMNSMTHWDEFAWEFEAQRWGKYWVDVKYYGLRRALGVQARIRSEEERAKAFLKPGGTREEPRRARLGTVYVPAHGTHQLVLFTPQDDPQYDFKLAGLSLVPAPEGEKVTQKENGDVILLAKDATTYSERMRYEPKEEKNCLGFWVLKEDHAEWEFELTKTGKFAVTVFQGCGKGNEGSTVALEIGDERRTFVVEDTGGFQNWKGVDAGEITIEEAGRHKLTVIPETQAAKAVMDIQKIVLRRVSKEEGERKP